MASILQLLRRVNGAAGAPPTSGRLVGEPFMNFPGVSGSSGMPTFWGFDGVAWREFTGREVASALEVLTGANNAKVLTPAGLASRTIATPSVDPTDDEGYIPRLGATGVLHSGFIPGGGGGGGGGAGIRFLDPANLAAAAVPPVGGFLIGDFIVHSGADAATVHASYTGAAGKVVDATDFMLYSGTAWNVIQSKVDLSAYLQTADLVAEIEDIATAGGTPAADLAIAIGFSIAEVPVGASLTTLADQFFDLLGEATVQVLTEDDEVDAETVFLSFGWGVASGASPTYFDFFEDTDNGTNRIRVSAPATLAADFELTLPNRTGTLGLSTLGVFDLSVPALAISPRASNGATSNRVETTTNKHNIDVIDFPAGSDTFAQFSLQMPEGWNGGTVTASFLWFHEATTTNFDVTFGIQALSLANAEALDSAFGTAVTVSDAGGTTQQLYRTAETAALTIAGSPVGGDWVTFQIYRDDDGNGTPGNDDLAVAARLVGVRIRYTRDAETDA
jgi:hypothetical protein